MRNLIVGICASLLLVALVGTGLAVDDKAKSHTGTVVSVDAEKSKLVMSSEDKGEHSHEIATTTKVTVDGKEAKLADLKKGDKITVTLGEDGEVSKLEVKRAK